MLGSVGLPELLLILLLALLLFGGKKLPEVARSMGQALRAFKDEASKLRSEVDVELQREEAKKGPQAVNPVARVKEQSPQTTNNVPEEAQVQ